MGYIAAAFGVLAVIALFFVELQKRKKFEADWEAQHPRSAFPFCGKTLLFYDPGHGNQIEYLDPAGRCYLWYPGNSSIVVGKWRADTTNIYFQYGLNTYNPITPQPGGVWNESPIAPWSASIMEAVPGDIHNLKNGLPFVLLAQPRIESLAEFGKKKRN